MEPEGSLPSLQELSTCTYPEPNGTLHCRLKLEHKAEGTVFILAMQTSKQTNTLGFSPQVNCTAGPPLVGEF
jgi:hypothetical protein